MASDERAPRSGSAGGERRDGAPRKDGSAYKGSSSRDGAPRTGGSSYKGSSSKDGAPRTGGSSYKGSSSRDGTPPTGGSTYRGTSSRDGAPRRDGKPGTSDRGRSDSTRNDSRPGASTRGAPYRGGAGRPSGSRDERSPRDERPVKKGPPAPEIPEDVVFGQLDKAVRSRLRTLSKENAEDVGRHLIMAGNLLDTDPELAYQHALVAAARGGRVDVVREAAAVTAYATGRYAEALREFRTVRRLNGSSEHLALMADCERGLGRPERAIALSQEPEAKTISPAARIELAIVIAGARSDMGEKDAALVSLKRLTTSDPDLQARIDEATVSVLRDLGRNDEADALEPAPVAVDEPDDDVVVYDTFEEPAEPAEEVQQ